MKVIFIKDLKNQGKKDDIKEVKPGFGEYLIKSGYAVLYSNKSLEILKNQKEQRNLEENQSREKAITLKNSLEKIVLTFKVKVGSNNKVFGNISTKQISEEIKRKGFDVDKKKIEIPNSLNSLGSFKIKILIYKDIYADVIIELIS